MKCKFWNEKGFYVLNKQAIAHCKNKGKCPKGMDIECNRVKTPKQAQRPRQSKPGEPDIAKRLDNYQLSKYNSSMGQLENSTSGNSCQTN